MTIGVPEFSLSKRGYVGRLSSHNSLDYGVYRF